MQSCSRNVPHVICLLLCLGLLSIFALAHTSARAAPAGAGPDEWAVHPLAIQGTAYIEITEQGFSPANISAFGVTDVTWANTTALTKTLVFAQTPGDNLIYLPQISAPQSELQAAIHSRLQAAATAIDRRTVIGPGRIYSQQFTQQGKYVFHVAENPFQSGQIIITGVALLDTSPMDGEQNVSTTRETVLRFTGALDPTSVNETAVVARFSGQDLPARLDLSPDSTRVTLFYNTPLPNGARVLIIVDGDQLKDAEGGAVDVDGDGQPGGTAEIAFDTASLSRIPDTDVWGYVYDSYNRNADGLERPVVGATIRVDGLPEANTVTDADGYFLLEDMPAPGFFVHIDGSTATNAPAGTQYVTVGKEFHSVVGQSTQLTMDGETFHIYLPPMALDDLQQLAPTQETAVGFGAGGKAELAEIYPDMDPTVWEQTGVLFPPNGAVDEAGNAAQQATIIPVDARRLPAPLPPGMNHGLDIAVIAPGATNFETPAPACFPNLSDPDTGEMPAPGEKRALLSFNHDTGQWEYAGSMTVSLDGMTVCTDPGVGIRAPGWHGSGPPPVGPPPPCTACCPVGGPETIAAQVVIAADPPDDPHANCDPCEKELAKCLKTCVYGLPGTIIPCLGATFVKTGGLSLPVCVGGPLLAIPFCVLGACPANHLRCRIAGPIVAQETESPFTVMDNGLIGSPLNVAQEIGDIVAQMSTLAYPYIMSGAEEYPLDVAQQLDELWIQANTLAGGDAISYLREEHTRLETELALLEADLDAATLAAPSYSVLYAAVYDTPRGSTISRGQTDPFGQYQLFLPRDGSLQIVLFYDPTRAAFALARPNLRSNAQYPLPRFTPVEVDENFLDFDEDELADLVEFVYGTQVNNPDSDGDGVPDGAEVQQGSNPLDGAPAQLGVLATADTPGVAQDICVNNDLAALADGTFGVALFDIRDPLQPARTTQVDTPGNAQAVACERDIVVVADGSPNLLVLDTSDPAAAAIRHTIDLGGTARGVVAAGTYAFAGTTNNRVVMVDLQAGSVIDSVDLAAQVQDVAVQGTTLYVLLGPGSNVSLHTFQVDGAGLTFLGQVDWQTYNSDPITGRRRLFVGGDYAYATAIGYDVIDIRDPAAMQRVGEATLTDLNSFKQIVDNGSGQGVAAAGANPSPSAPHHIALYDTSVPTDTTVFITQFQTPGLARAVALHKGWAFVADGDSGLQVLNYLAADSLGVAPTVTLSTPLGDKAEEESQLSVSALVEEDVQVRAVDFYVDSALAATDGSFPFVYHFQTPGRDQQATLALRARAADTGGNVGWSDTVTLTLVEDATPPRVTSVMPAASAVMTEVTDITATFNEAIDPATLSTTSFTLLTAGPDGQFDTADDTAVAATAVDSVDQNQVAVLRLATALPSGGYRTQIGTSVTDSAGNPLAEPFQWQFRVFRACNPSSTVAFSALVPYLSFDDSPLRGCDYAYFHLEDFEDEQLDTPGVASSTGSVCNCGGLTDSVDGDDGTIDGSGSQGHSWFSGSGATGIRFDFDADTLGELPTHAGIAWTDGAGDLTFEAFDGDGNALGTFGPIPVGDGSFSGATGEDRFAGVVFADGIGAIHIRNSSGGIEVDHLQYGRQQ